MSILYNTSKLRPKPAKPREQYNPYHAGQTRDRSQLKFGETFPRKEGKQ